MWDIYRWKITDRERDQPLPSDGYLSGSVRHVHRAIDVAAPVSVTFRWLCQLTVAPYSYDWMTLWRHRSPRTLTPGADDLHVGQLFLIGEIRDWCRDSHISLSAIPAAVRIYGPIAVTYQVAPRDSGSRILVRITLGVTTSVWSRLRANIVTFGDAIMMWKQLRTLGRLAERDATNAARR